ncbi:hypothetical protein ACFX19_032521 [Malus domestica]
MENQKDATMHIIYLLGFTFLFYLSLAVAQEKQNSLQTYIVFLENPSPRIFFVESDLDSWYQSFLLETIANSNQQRIVHAYRTVVTGFADKLTPEEVKAMETKKGVIIGLLDTGIGPDHPSFSDEGVSTPPAKWMGKCDFNGKFGYLSTMTTRFISVSSKGLEVFNDLKVFHDNTPFGLESLQMVPPLFLREGKSLPCRLAQSFSSDRENRRAEITRGVVENELETGDGIVSLKNGWK